MSKPASLFALLLLLPALLFAQQRTFVATNGLDTNPCTPGAPCRTFGAAIALTASGGEVIALTSGGYGTFNITSGLSVIAPAGIYAGISVFAGAGITVNAGGAVVNVRGLTINGLGGQDAIDFSNGSQLHVENVIATGFSNGSGLYAHVDGARFTVRDSVFRNNKWGVFMSNVPTSLEGSVDHTRFEQNGVAGTEIEDNGKLTVRDSVYFNDNLGARMTPASTSCEFTIDNCLFSAAVNGIAIDGTGNGNGTARIGRSTFIDLVQALEKSGAGTIVSFGNNQFAGNGSDGTIDATIALK